MGPRGEAENAVPDVVERVTFLRVVWTPHGDHEPDWAYHLRMGDIDCDEAADLGVE